MNLYWIKTKLKEDVAKQLRVPSNSNSLDKHKKLNIYYASANSPITNTQAYDCEGIHKDWP